MSLDPIPATPEALAKTLKRRPVLWVGAGASIAAGHPSTRVLVDALVADAERPLDPALPFEQVADAYVASMGAGALGDLLQRLLGGSRPITELHRALARQAADGAFAAIVTTNYDDLLERALPEAEARFVFQTLEDNAVVVDPDADVRLLKLHGSRDDWRRVVLSGQAYATFGARYPFLEKQLDVLLRSHPVLFVGCSLQDPRILDWLAALDDDAAVLLKPWRALMTRDDWDAALAMSDARTPSPLRRARLRPLLLDHHGQLTDLWTTVAPPKRPAGHLELLIELDADGLTARLDGGPTWTPEDVLADASFVKQLDALRELGTSALPTDEHGVLSPAAASAAAFLRQHAATVGDRLTSALLDEAARRRLRAAVQAGSAGTPALLQVRVRVGQALPADSPAGRADRILALPWELLRVDARFPVEDHTLDLAREAVVDNADVPGDPDQPLSIVATVAAPVDGVELDHEGETYRLWNALGARDEERLIVTDLGTLEDLAKAVEDHHPPVVHFTGHGRPGELIFEDDASCSKPVKVDDLVRKLRDAGPFPRLIYLSACHGEPSPLAPLPEGEGSPEPSPPTPLPGGEGSRSGGSRNADVSYSPSPPGRGGWGVRVPRMVDAAAIETAPSTAAALHRAGFPQVVAYFGPVGDAQATRTAAAFYAALAGGMTARAALRRARGVAAEPLKESDGRATSVYPLGWAQQVLYQRGPDRPTAKAAPPADASPRLDTPLERVFERLDREGGSRRVEGIVGVQQLRFGFIGRRRPRGDAIRRWRRGQRTLVIQGLGGLGKTALCTELLRVVGRGRPVLALDGRHAGAQPSPIAALWQEVQAVSNDESWLKTLAAFQQDGLTGVSLAQAVTMLAASAGGLVVYLDDAESLQLKLQDQDLGRWRDDELRGFWTSLVATATDKGTLALVASSRYRPEATPERAVLALEPMSRWEVVRLMTWMPTLRRLPHEDRAWLADRVDGHPRTVEYLEVLARAKEEGLVPPGGRFTGNWRADVLEPILEDVGERLEADLLLPEVWRALDADAQEHLGRLSVLTAPAPWEAVRAVAPEQDRGRTLVDAGLLSPFQVGRDVEWAPHRLVSETVRGLWEGDVEEAHRRIGGWYQEQFGENGAVISAQRAVEHFCAADDADAVFPTAEALTLRLRDAGRYREALAWIERILDAHPSGSQKGLALFYQVQLLRHAGSLASEGAEKLGEALILVGKEGAGWILHELGEFCRTLGRLQEASSYFQRALKAKEEIQGEESTDVATSLHSLAGVLQAQGDLAGAREKLERSLHIKAAVFGTEQHPDVAASLHALAGVLQAQGDLAGAREKLERVLEIEAKVYGSRDHYSTAITEMNLGSLLFELDEKEAAVELLAHAYAVFQRQLGPEHPYTRQLASLYEKKDE